MAMERVVRSEPEHLCVHYYYYLYHAYGHNDQLGQEQCRQHQH